MTPRTPRRPPVLRAAIRRRPRLSWWQALGLVTAVTVGTAVVAGTLVTRTDPDRYPDIGTGLWWAATTVTTVGYGDVVPASTPGRVIGVVLMFVGIACFAFLTAVAASAIVIFEVGDEERAIERKEREIEATQRRVLQRLNELATRLDRWEGDRDAAATGGPGHGGPAAGPAPHGGTPDRTVRPTGG